VTVDLSSFFQPPDDEAGEPPDDLTFLADASDEDWAKLVAYAQRRRFRAGDIVMRQGDVDRSLAIVTDGRLEVLVIDRDGRRTRRLATIDAGSILGELAFLDGLPRSATLRALTDVALLWLSVDAFEALSLREPALARAFLFDLGRIVARRLRRANATIQTLMR
jgi:CRP-like cAMP-binding protein